MPSHRHHPDQMELPLQLSASSSVTVTRFPGGEVRLKPTAPKIEGSVKDAAKELGLSPRQVRRMLVEGDLPGWKPAKRKWVVNMIAVYERRRKREERE
jgi:hypothetical protein